MFSQACNRHASGASRRVVVEHIRDTATVTSSWSGATIHAYTGDESGIRSREAGRVSQLNDFSLRSSGRPPLPFSSVDEFTESTKGLGAWITHEG